MSNEVIYMTKHGELKLFWKDERNLIWYQTDDDYRIPIGALEFILIKMNMQYMGEL